MGNWFYGFILAGIFLAAWITTQELMIAVLMADIITICLYDQMPTLIWPTLAIVNIIAIAKTLFYKPITPKYSS